MSGLIEPFASDALPEVPLPRSPLAEVLIQVRFPTLASIGRQDFIASFQEAVRGEYPLLSEERQFGFVFGPQGLSASPQAEGSVLWRLTDLAKVWRLTLGPNFLALETKQYSNRAEFLERARTAVAACEKHIRPNFYDRVGLRYINRITDGEWLANLPELVRPEVLGPFGHATGVGPVTGLKGQIVAEYQVGSDVLLVRSAQLPPGETHDPVLEPASAPCWLLDLDMSTTPKIPLAFET
ncbi:MAG: hypothetical protein QOI92_2706, partial [Chloroflexota bacterium]|nr:hypothetical protein [Chloroflexota bacterium]